MSINPVTAIATAIAECSKAFGTHMATRKVRLMKAALDAGENYIHVQEGFGDYKDITQARKDKLLRKFRIRFFKFN